MQYRAGTATFTNGSNVVTGISTEWLANVSIGDYLVGIDPSMPSNQIVAYEIGGVVSDTQLTITANYGGNTVSGIQYVVHIDFHPNGAPKWADTDIQFAAIQNRWNQISVSQSDIGTAATLDAGTGPDQIPTNADLHVDSMLELSSTVGITGQKISIDRFHPTESIGQGSGSFFWGVGRHDGWSVIDPNRTFPAASEWGNGHTDPAVIAWFADSGADADCWISERKSSSSIEIAETGAFGNGITDDTAQIFAADKSGKTYEFDATKTYVFDGDNLPNIDNMRLNGARIEDVFSEKVVYEDQSSGRVIGLMHNYKQFTDIGGSTPVSTGNITTPPKANPRIIPNVNLAAFWYQDFGLARTLTGSFGNEVWYYWTWNFSRPRTDLDPNFVYDANRHPLVGYYRGDDVNVLGWQAYWLAEYGFTSIIPQVVGSKTATSITATWTSSTDLNHWFYQYLENVENSKKLKYCCWGESTDAGTASELTNTWTDIISNVYATYRNFLTIEKGGRTYACIFTFEGEAIRGILDSFSGSANTEAFFASMATLAQTQLGVDGIYIMARTPTTTLCGSPSLEANGVIYSACAYEQPSLSFDDDLYSNYYDHLNYRGVKQRLEIMTASTGHNSQYPHPSGWTRSEPTAAQIGRAVRAAVDQVNDAGDTNLLAVYNLSEWAEGGAGLMPTVGMGFDHLEAIRAAISSNNIETKEKNVNRSSIQSNVELFNNTLIGRNANTETLLAFGNFDDMTAGDIEGGVEGDRLRIVITASNRVRFTTTGNKNVGILAATYVRCNAGDYIDFVFDGTNWNAIATSSTDII